MTNKVGTSKAEEPPKKKPARKLISMLGSTDKLQRDKAVSKLRKLLNLRKMSPFAMLRLWGGLWECFWLSDKPLVQQALAADLADLQLQVDPVNAFTFLDGFIQTMMRTWIRVDFLRRDKFIILQATFLHRAYKHVALEDWDKHFAISTAEILDRNFKKRTEPNFVLDVLFCNLDKLRDVAVECGPPPIEILQILLEPFYNLLCSKERFIIVYTTDMFQALYDTIDPSAAEKDGILKSKTVPSNFQDSDYEMSVDEDEFDDDGEVPASSGESDGDTDDPKEKSVEDKLSKTEDSKDKNLENQSESRKDVITALEDRDKSPSGAKDIAIEVSEHAGKVSSAESLTKVDVLNETSAEAAKSSTIPIPVDKNDSSGKAEEGETVTEERADKEQSSGMVEQNETGAEEGKIDGSKNPEESTEVAPENRKSKKRKRELSPLGKCPRFSMWNTPTGVKPPQSDGEEEVDPFNLKQNMQVISDKLYELASDETRKMAPSFRKNLYRLRKLFDPNDPTNKVFYRIKPPPRFWSDRKKDLCGIWNIPNRKFTKHGWAG